MADDSDYLHHHVESSATTCASRQKSTLRPCHTSLRLHLAHGNSSTCYGSPSLLHRAVPHRPSRLSSDRVQTTTTTHFGNSTAVYTRLVAPQAHSRTPALPQSRSSAAKRSDRRVIPRTRDKTSTQRKLSPRCSDRVAHRPAGDRRTRHQSYPHIAHYLFLPRSTTALCAAHRRRHPCQTDCPTKRTRTRRS